jgi:NAD(P)-dependent dehydrogenase (short-subunit alcohol dehydrogenase family)
MSSSRNEALKIVLVTGASSGIGRATAEVLARRGHMVFGTARTPERVAPIPGVTLVPLDVTDEASVKRGVQKILKSHGNIDVLVNNAGSAVLGAFEETSVEQAKALFDTNVFGVVRTSQAVLPSMRAQRSGLIINVSSVLGFLPAPYMALYSSTKHALEGLSESLDHEVREFGVRVVLIEPTFIRTGLSAHSITAASTVSAYDAQRTRAAAAVAASIDSAPDPLVVAEEIARTIESPYRLRHPVGPRAKLFSRLRRFMPEGSMDKQLRKSFALEG